MHPINKSIWNSNGMFIVGAWCEMTLILMLVIYAHQFSPSSRKRVLILFFHIPGRNVARHRCTNGWFGRSVFTTASNCRLCASCWTYGSSWTHWISRSIFGTERNRFHSIIGREAYQVHFGATSPLHTQHLLISFFVLPHFDRIAQCDFKTYLKGIEQNDIFVAGTLEEKASELQRKFEVLITEEKELNDKACKG